MEAAGKRWIVYPSRKDKIRIWNLADIHWMSKACAEKAFRRDLQTIIDDPYSFWVGGGDYCDFIGYDDKRFDPDCVADWITVKQLGDLGDVGKKQIRDLFMPIKHKCLGLVLGNHEKSYQRHTKHEAMHSWLCEELGVPNLQYSALFDLVLCRTRCKAPKLLHHSPGAVSAKSFRIFIHHGAGYATTPGGKLNKLVQFMQSFDADLYFCGHVHDQLARKEPAIGADATCTKLIERQRLGLISGSYLKTYCQGVITYGEQRGYRPVSLGAAVAEITPETRTLKAAI